MIYFDYASTTPLNQEVLTTYTKLLENYYANADSLHTLGRETQRLMEKSRAQIAQLLSVRTDELLFASCASEANSMAIKGFALANRHRGNHLITTSVEHSSVLAAFEQLEHEFGFRVTYLPVTKQGIVDVQALKKALDKDTVLVSIMYVNNETGAINPLAEISAYIHEHSRAAFHVDCVQALGKLSIPLSIMDMATFSAHKIYGVKGSALLYKQQNIKLLPLINGGQQEQGMRGGTSNAPANIVFAKTLRLALEHQSEHYEYVQGLHDYLCDQLQQMENVQINSNERCVPHIINASFLKIGSEIMLNALDERGICVSAQSTCASRSKAHSYVLAAMGLGEQAATHAIRISLSHMTTLDEVKQLIQALKEINHDYGTK